MKFYITGASSFIGSNLVEYLNGLGHVPTVLLRDDLSSFSKSWKNLAGLSFHTAKRHEIYPCSDDILIHLSADSSTTAEMGDELLHSNFFAFEELSPWRFGKVLYASSASVYGAEEKDFSERTDGLKPLHAYGMSKLMMDRKYGGSHIGLRFFNVYGPREQYKGHMKSIVSRYIDHEQNGETIELYLGRIGAGDQARDFIYVGDVCESIYRLAISPVIKNGIFNIGTGHATSLLEIARAIGGYHKSVPMPEKFKKQYQYYTCADVTKLKQLVDIGKFKTIKEGIELTKKRNAELGLDAHSPVPFLA